VIAGFDGMAQKLSQTTGLELELVEDSILEKRDSFAATLRSRSKKASGLQLDVIVHILGSAVDSAPLQFWALAFTFVNGLRVAPQSLSHMVFQFDPDKNDWLEMGWEADDYEEWAGLERFDE
jgi:hypothetical protein